MLFYPFFLDFTLFARIKLRNTRFSLSGEKGHRHVTDARRFKSVRSVFGKMTAGENLWLLSLLRSAVGPLLPLSGHRLNCTKQHLSVFSY